MDIQNVINQYNVPAAIGKIVVFHGGIVPELKLKIIGVDEDLYLKCEILEGEFKGGNTLLHPIESLTYS